MRYLKTYLSSPYALVRIAILLAAAFLSIYPYYYQIGLFPIQTWDESRVSMNALNMYYDGNWGVTYFDGEPDLWNTKPPLLIWLQTIFLHLMGPCEKAIRMPSVIAAIATNLLIIWACNKIFKNKLVGLIAAIVLVTMPIYVCIHGTRTGDYDALLTFFTTAFVFFIAFFTERYRLGDRGSSYKYLYLASLMLSLAVLTKGVQGMVFCQ